MSEIQFQKCIKQCPPDKLFYKTYNTVDPNLTMVIYQGGICTDEIDLCKTKAPRVTNYYTANFPFVG